jgi:hypothetical protein
MATNNLYTNLLGYDPYERQLQDRKLWAGLYGSASSPYEKMGLGLAQLGGTLFGQLAGDEEKDPLRQLAKISNEASQQFSPQSPEYYRYIAENSTNPMVKQNAAQEALKADEKATERTRKDIEFLSKHPDQLATELQYYQTRLERQARTLGWNPQDPLAMEVTPEIQAKLEKTPEYKKILQLSNAGQVAIVDKAQKEEKENLGIETSKLTITKLKNDINDANKTQAAAEAFMTTYGLDPTKPIPEQIATNPALAQLQYVPGVVSSLMATQQKALQKKKQSSGVIVLK